MNKTIKILAGLLLVQLIVIIGLNMANNNSANANAAKILLTDIENVDQLIFLDKQGEQSRLIKQDGAWTMPDYGNMPAMNNKIEELLTQLREQKVSWPSATSSSAATRFEVAKDNAQKTVEFYSDGKKQQSLYLGTSPGYKKLHARVDDDNNIYVVDLAQYDLPAKPESWLDKTVLKVEGAISAIKTDAFSLSSASSEDEQVWSVEPMTEGKQLDQEAVKRWVKRFNDLVVNKLAAEEEVQDVVIQNPALTVNITSDSANSNLAFYKHDDRFFVKRFGEEPVFEIAKYQAETLVDATADTFQTDETENDEAQEAAAPAPLAP